MRTRWLVAAPLFIALVAAAIGSLGAPLITAVAETYDVSLSTAQWTLTITLLTGAVTTPVAGRLGTEGRRRPVALGMLVLVTVGSVATVVPAPFAVLLAGRALQGTGLGLVALLMAIVRRHLGDRAPATIAMLSVASTAGIGVGYPLSGLLAQAGGIRAAYLLGLVVSAAALVAAALVLPREEPGTRGERVDWAGAALLSAGLVAILLVTSDTRLWTAHLAVAVAVLVGGIGVLAAWVAVERRVSRPLVDLAALRHPAVAGANLVMGVAGVAMYCLFSLITRYVQTPTRAGYGYGLSEVEAGLVLVPFSVLGFVAGRVVPWFGRRTGPFPLLAAHGLVVTGACALFAAARGAGVAWPVLAMAVLGYGVGGFSAVMPQAILAVTPQSETAAAMSVNGVVRAVGFSAGSALSGLVLAGYTPAGQFAPDAHGYTTAAWLAGGLAVVAVVIPRVLGGRRGRV